MSERKTIVITGASDGIGAAAARILSKKGHEVILVGRSAVKTSKIASELSAQYYLADFADFVQVRALARILQSNHPHIDVLANNAGGIMGNREVTIDGFEKTFQVNHLAQFLLTDLLMQNLIASNTTVIQTASSAAKRFGNMDINDLQNEKAYSPTKAYGDAKLANILFTNELQRRYGHTGINAVAFHPGIVGTSFANNTTHLLKYLYHTPLIKQLFTISPRKGAETLVWLAESEPITDWQPGKFYYKKALSSSSAQSNDPALAKELWDKCLAMLQ